MTTASADLPEGHIANSGDPSRGDDCATLYIYVGWGVGVARDSRVALDYTD